MRHDWFKQFSINQLESALRFSQISGNRLLWSYVVHVDDAHVIQFCSTTFFQLFFQDQDSTSKIINKSYALCFKDTHEIWFCSAKFFSKSKSCSRWGSGSGSWFYFGFQYQTYISFIEDTHPILYGSANSFKSYCVHMKSPPTYRQTNRRKFFWLVLSSKTYKTWKFVKRREFFLFSLMRLQYFLFLHTPYVTRT